MLLAVLLSVGLVTYALVSDGGGRYVVGRIAIKVHPGVDIRTLVAAHGGDPDAVAQTFTPPFDQDAIQLGLDRHWIIHVEPGTERAQVATYRKDPTVEHVQTIGTEGGLFGPSGPARLRRP